MESKSIQVAGEPVLIAPIALAQSSIYQRYGEFNNVFYEDGMYSIFASETTVYTNDYTIKQGFGNWYMLTYEMSASVM